MMDKESRTGRSRVLTCRRFAQGSTRAYQLARVVEDRMPLTPSLLAYFGQRYRYVL
jgi:hypothetical protein